MSKNNKPAASTRTTGGKTGAGRLAPIDARHRQHGTWGSLTGPKLMSTRFEDVEFMKHTTSKTNDYLKRRAKASTTVDFERLEKARRAADPMEVRRRQRLFVDKSRDHKLIRERFESLHRNQRIRRAVSNSNKRRSDVPSVVNKGYLLGGFTFQSSMQSEAKRQFHSAASRPSTTGNKGADDDDDVLDKRERRKDEMANAYINENHSHFKFPLRSYEESVGKPWVSSNGLNSKNWRDRTRSR
eukprot:INCI2820.1.p1 GENE.INCI2820.1~~INCI2820.1.p1  ORF type:complete len:242 (-),score=38.68 INCI2820.1:217-942(-)